ncbi:PPOX class F420-dependent oxidoreductase [Streptomyces sp. DSM 44915]|uniref:PPOX class F420-dependent oxidoreductase n=1 Tax=Streptomyces chisholmiae TaxID=3075540 RepID=A0ABU2JRG3_9ACTN|nr:PPOX class F420-dependent oxidoreductase [Streptomyces sp. DSM 44915]MDT0267571.1 PPOX class F420-dependent oxidoreductase [Streptomyces sp. DSM 44915]
MAVKLPDALKRVLDGKVFVTIATIQPDGSPQLSPVWATWDGDEVLISTTVDRRKETNLRRDPRVTVLVVDPEQPYSYAEIRGEASLTTEGGQALIDELSLKYTGKHYAEFNPASERDAERVVVRVRARKIVGQGIV